MTQLTSIDERANTVVIGGPLHQDNVRLVLSSFYRMIEQRGYLDINIDFSECTAMDPGASLAIISHVSARRLDGVDFYISLPSSNNLERLFRNANWAHFLCPDDYPPSEYESYGNMSVVNFKNAHDQTTTVNGIMSTILGAVGSLSRSNFAAFEWAVNEITDNVLNHADSPTGGFVQVSTFPKRRKILVVVSDSGRGIASTLRQGHTDITSDTEALHLAIREGVTRDKSVGQGNGLYGSWKIAEVSNGKFFINSGNACLLSTPSIRKRSPGLIHAKNERIPFNGSLVSLEIDYTNEEALSRALNFGGRQHHPFDYIEGKYEIEDGNSLKIQVKEEARSYGNRHWGRFVRTKIENLLDMEPSKVIFVDMTDINMISSSFADEAFAKIIDTRGSGAFKERIRFENCSYMTNKIIERSVRQRSELI